jgi:hypothetical protein
VHVHTDPAETGYRGVARRSFDETLSATGVEVRLATVLGPT